MSKYRQVIWLLLPLGFMSCEEVTRWELDPGGNGQLVVEATLTDEYKVQEIRLSLSYDALNGNPPAVDDALVTVAANGSSIIFLPDSQRAGWYKSESAFAVIDDLEYTLTIDWQGTSYTATSELADVAPMPFISFRSYGNRDSLTFAEFAPLYNPDQQAMYEMRVFWAHQTQNPADRALLYFYTFSSIEVGSLVRPTRDTVFFPRGSIVVARKFGLSDDYADYLRSLVTETEWRGGPFYSASASIPTNMSNGALGFFSACAVEVDTLIAR